MLVKNSITGWIFVLAICMLTAVAAAGQTIYVDANALPGGDGLTWATAYKYLQDALTAAVSGDEIWVAAGTYYPSVEVGGTGDRYRTFQMINGVAIYGGFPDTGNPAWEDRDPNTYVTILSGDLNGDDVEVGDPCDLLGEPTRAENSYHVVTGSGTDATALLDGFTVAGGNANQYPNSTCCFPHFGLGCDDPMCESMVCSFDSYCCSVAWYETCAALAWGFCSCAMDMDQGGGMYTIGGGPTVINWWTVQGSQLPRACVKNGAFWCTPLLKQKRV